MNLLVLTQNNCRYCEIAKQYLNDEQVDYEIINMSENPEYQEKYNVMGAPTILLLDGDEVIVKTTGFDPKTVDALIEQL